MKRFFNFNSFAAILLIIVGGVSIFGKCNKENLGFYALTLNSHPTYTLKVYADVKLTTPINELNKIKKDTTIYIVVPKRTENTAVKVTGADQFSDTVAIVKMTSNKTITAAYSLDTANFKYTPNSTSCMVWGYVGTAKNIEIPAIIQGLPVETIGDVNASALNSFRNINVQSVIIPYGVKTIEKRVFSTNTSLEKVTIPNSVIAIGSDAFSGCDKLNNLIIPGSVKTIGQFAFYGCKALDNIRVEALTPPVLQKIEVFNDYSTFAGAGTFPILTISVPSSALANYQKEWTNSKLINNTSKVPVRPSVNWVGY